jgi:hypothetical protein
MAMSWFGWTKLCQLHIFFLVGRDEAMSKELLYQQLGLRLHDGLKPAVPFSYYYKHQLIFVLIVIFLCLYL